ncbi:MAG: hypothetical protein EAZ70_12425 [Runella slithyformis]|jgi:beta-lactamase superfamily II metal-dependent hydrolase|nr:MAG: hypothetical protein EAY79_00370 [Runella slithyformis]TAE93048.1 MAG: hypothetical protein EAZ80_11830 [Runella slithyformis]TAF23998.1 MAG: hypothetical protein EAZ70_12425 [Runella slithyformis]TAF43142.1 MAG: hypothetical protein EAZ63_14120 [Runella slithyformis]TAF83687.1 MAG: hypothetical protein EAZ50_00180 [Runella slithyformis]
MKQKSFSKKHPATVRPYLAYWFEEWGEMQTTNGDWGNPRISLIDTGGDCYRDYDSKSHEEALDKAEKWLREIDFPARMNQETIINSLEEDYVLYGLK